MSWNEEEFGRDDGIICDSEWSSAGFTHQPCGAKTWVTDDQGHGYVTYECERGHHFAVQYDYDEEHEPDCWCAECLENAQHEAIRNEEMFGS